MYYVLYLHIGVLTDGRLLYHITIMFKGMSWATQNEHMDQFVK